MLFKVGKVSIITDTLPVFLHIMLDLLGFLYPFRSISAIWVEICDRGNWESLPFSPILRYLGRDFRPAAQRSWNLYPFRPISAVWVEKFDRQLQESLPFCTISAVWVEICERRYLESLPFSPILCYLGRDFQPAATGFSTFFAGFTLFG